MDLFLSLALIVGKSLLMIVLLLSYIAYALYADHPHLARLDEVSPGEGAGAVQRLAGLGGEPSRQPFVSPIGDFYLTNPIARASGVMAECSALARGARLEAAE